MKITAPGGHLDQMLRQTRHHHVTLSAMADTKANMLITTSALLITLSGPHILNPIFKWAVLVLAFFCMATIALAIYTLMPKLPPKSQAPPDVHSPGFNLLFFGDFTRLDYQEYQGAMEQIMNDVSMSYEMQLREVYSLGKFLATRKYRTLRLAYMTFISGLVLSSVVLLIGLKLH